MQNEGTKVLNLAPLLAVLFALIAVFHLGNALVGRSLFRPHHLSTALEYAHGHINLLRPVIVGFNPTSATGPAF
jgi:hypothetical protein